MSKFITGNRIHINKAQLTGNTDNLVNSEIVSDNIECHTIKIEKNESTETPFIELKNDSLVTPTTVIKISDNNTVNESKIKKDSNSLKIYHGDKYIDLNKTTDIFDVSSFATLKYTTLDPSPVFSVPTPLTLSHNSTADDNILILNNENPTLATSRRAILFSVTGDVQPFRIKALDNAMSFEDYNGYGLNVNKAGQVTMRNNMANVSPPLHQLSIYNAHSDPPNCMTALALRRDYENTYWRIYTLENNFGITYWANSLTYPAFIIDTNRLATFMTNSSSSTANLITCDNLHSTGANSYSGIKFTTSFATGTNQGRLYWKQNNLYLSTYLGSTEKNGFRCNTSGEVYLPTVTTTGAYDTLTRNPADGRVYINTSSIRYKNLCEDQTIPSELIYQLEPKRYYFKSDENSENCQIGIISEEAELVHPSLISNITEEIINAETGLPEMVTRPHNVKYQAIYMMMLNEIKKLRTEIDDLQTEIATKNLQIISLQDQITTQGTEITAIKTFLGLLV